MLEHVWNLLTTYFAEIFNFFSATMLLVAILVLLFELMKEKKRYIWAIVVSCLMAIILLTMRNVYYVNVVFSSWTRVSHGSNYVAIPSPLLWTAITVLVGGFVFEIKHRRRLEYLLELVVSEFDEEEEAILEQHSLDFQEMTDSIVNFPLFSLGKTKGANNEPTDNDDISMDS